MRIVAVALTLPPPVVGPVVVVGVGVGAVGLDPPPPQDETRAQTITTIGESAVARCVMSDLLARASRASQSEARTARAVPRWLPSNGCVLAVATAWRRAGLRAT